VPGLQRLLGFVVALSARGAALAQVAEVHKIEAAPMGAVALAALLAEPVRRGSRLEEPGASEAFACTF